MSFLPPNEKIIETKKCRLSGQEFFITDKDLEFYEKISPIFAGKKYLIPSPTLCPDERQRRRLAFRNERKLYHRKCDKTGNQIISIYSPDKPFTVYDQKVWWSDDWSALDYGTEFDFERSFFGQFRDLIEKVPLLSLNAGNNENSEYVQQTGYSKNCYLIFASDYCEDCYYIDHAFQSKNCIDCTEAKDSEYCINCIDIVNSYHVYESEFCKNCRNCRYVFDCENCHDCILSSGLRNKKFCIQNQQYEENEYRKKEAEFLNIFIKNKDICNTLFSDIKTKTVRRNLNLLSCENCLGNNIENSNGCFLCFDGNKGENLKYVNSFFDVKDMQDVNNTTEQQSAYDCISVGYGGYGNYFCNFGWTCAQTFYSMNCLNLQSSFACVSIRGGKNVILNKSYGMHEYDSLCGKIVDHMISTGEWGEFFPHELSPFGYNETVAQEYFPINESEARSKGWNWKNNEETSSYHGPYYTPLNIQQYNEKVVGYDVAQKNIDQLLNGILNCEVSGKPFKIIKQELVFCIENTIPLPTKHPDQRHAERLSRRNKRKMHEKNCDMCHKAMNTTYSSDRKEKIVCEECYRKIIY